MDFDYAVMSLVQSVYAWGGELFDKIFIFATFLGEEMFVIIALMSVYWCIDKKMGEYLLFAQFCSLSFNGIFKDIIRRPRPFLTERFQDLRYVEVDTLLVNTTELSSSFSFPSGHSQTAGALYCGAAVWKKNKKIWTASIFITLMVMISRVYLGVHYPTDVIAGGIIGVVVAIICALLFRRFYDKRLLLFAVAVLLSMTALFLDFSADTMKSVGVGLGAMIGFVLESAYVNFDSSCKPLKALLRVIFGLLIVLALRLGLKVIFPENMWFDGLRYMLIGFTMTFIWPFAFTKFKI